ncbi:DUF3152 domain-containing protein [Streptomyces sp. NPDC020742]|uniref:DUF3152 domain-containing protein n=1 Tax=Streptomyces sp. NPDC020742 TaxID=3154897 RepID=UPI00340FC57E
MGRHSRRGRPETPADTPDPATPPGAPAAGPGSGRRRREPPEGDTVRGGHPEQREPGGGWGAFPTAPSAPAPGQAAPRIPRPRAEMSGTRPMAVPGRESGPRREYVAAFDAAGSTGAADGTGLDDADDDVFRAGAPGAAGFPRAAGDAQGGTPVPPGGRFTGRSVVFERSTAPAADAAYAAHPAGAVDAAGEPAGGHPAEASGAPGGDGGEVEEARHGARKGGMGRTFTGAAAAAVTTVLAVVIAGQVTEQHKKDGEPQPRSGPDRSDGTDDEASRSHARPAQDAKAASYDEQMTQVFPLAADLTASGRFTPVPGGAKAPGHGKVLRYRVDIEEGLPLDGKLFAEAVHKTLNDDRSWAHGGAMTFERVSSGHADFVITLASPGTTGTWCAKSGLDTTEDNVSCDSAATERVMINAYRWAQGAKTYGHDKMLAYRQMLINHEVGHRLGHNHESCSRQGALAPVMMQQTKFLTTDGATCRPNSWPFPTQR